MARLVLLTLASLIVLVIVGSLVWLHTEGGSEQLGRFITHEAASSIAGSLKVRAIHVGGFLTICVDDADLRDPDGHQVITAEQICVRLNPLALEAKRLSVSEASLRKPWIEIAAEEDEQGLPTTSLKRALAPRKPSPQEVKPQGSFDWTIDVGKLSIEGGHVAVRPGVKEPSTFELGGLQLANTHARYASDGGALGLELTAQLASPGEGPVALRAEARLEGPIAAGRATLGSLRFQFGQSGLVAQGAWDFAHGSGELHLRDLRIAPADLQAIAPSEPPLLAGPVSGEGDLLVEGKRATVDLRLRAGGGAISAKAAATLGQKAPDWNVAVALEKVDPGSVSGRAPHGAVSAVLKANGKGAPAFDRHGVRGRLGVALHVGPARLDRVGPVVTDLKADLEGRSALVRAFSATALGLEVKAHGAAALDALSLDVEVNAPSLSQVARAVAVLTRKPAAPMAGTLHLTSRVTGSPTRPDAEVHVRAPWLRWGPTLAADGLAVDGLLDGELSQPDGQLVLAARRLRVGDVDLGGPRVDMGLEWPVAHLRVDAGVKNGTMQVAGDARIDDDRDGLLLSDFVIAWPENELRLAHDVRVHFRDAVILEPLDLTSPHGEVRLSAELRPARRGAPGAIDAALVLSKLDLSFLPHFALPPGKELKGLVEANAVVQGALPHPDLDLRVDVQGGGLRRLEELAADGHLHAHLHGGRLRTDGWVRAPPIGRLDLNGELPLASLAELPANSPVRFDLAVTSLDLAELSRHAGFVAARREGLQGRVELRVLANGTLAAPKATVAFDARGLGTAKVKGISAHAGVLVEAGKATLDGDVSLEGQRIAGFAGQQPLDLAKLLRDPAWLSGAMTRPLTFDLAVTQLDLRHLVTAGALPQGSEGTVSLGVHVGGTPARPGLQVSAVGRDLVLGRLRGLDFQSQLTVGEDVRLHAGAVSQGVVVARVDLRAAVSGAELVELASSGHGPDELAPLLDRALSVNLDVPGLPLVRASELTGSKALAEGRLVGHVTFSGTPARPSLSGRLTLRDLASQTRKLGSADVYVEADGNGALLHLGIDPPGGGSFLGHAQLRADLGARALLRDGGAALLDGALSGSLRAQKLDLAFLGGLLPGLRRAAGTLDAEVQLAGLAGKPTAQGDAHLRRGLFDVVGQGVFDDIGLNATFSPKEVVVDRLTGSTGDGTFSAIVVAARKPQPDAPDRFEFTGEIHAGDAESARDRKTPEGRPVVAGPVPLRQGGDQRADLTGELDLFGDLNDGVLTVNAKIPDARLKIRQLPDKKLPGLKENPDVLLVHEGERPHPPGREPEEVDAEARARKEATFRLEAHLDLHHLYVQAPDFEFPVESDMRFSYDARDPDNPTADGTVHVPQGSFSALGRRFVIMDATITETGGELQNPDLEIKARYENPKATVVVSISGTAKDPQLEMTSNPPMDQDAIAFFLATGRVEGRATQSGGGIDLSSAATSVLGGILFGELRKQLADVLPVDVLTIETGDKGVSMASVGKYVGDRVYLGYTARLTPAPGENQQEGRIEYEISKSVNAEATVGDKNRDLSVIWSHDF